MLDVNYFDRICLLLFIFPESITYRLLPVRIFLCTFNGLSKSGPLYYIDAYVVYNSSSFPDDASSHGFSMNRARNKSFVSIERGERRM